MLVGMCNGRHNLAWLVAILNNHLLVFLFSFLAVSVAHGDERPRRGFPEIKFGDRDAYIHIYGQINKSALYYNDGQSSLNYWLVDNDSSSTRTGLRLFRQLGYEWTVAATVEGEWNPYSTATVNRINRGDIDWNTGLLRKAEIYFDNRSLGTFWIGQGSMASDGTAEVDLSSTAVVGYSDVTDIFGGQLYQQTDGLGVSEIAASDTFSNFDGLSRKLRVRYDTRPHRGFTLGASVGTKVVPVRDGKTSWDVALKYSRDRETYRLRSAAAFSRPGGRDSTYDGSMSVLHIPSGISLTFATAYVDRTDRKPGYVYSKLGYQSRIFEFGKTAISIDAYSGADLKARGSESTSVGFQVVQNVMRWNTEFYLGIRLIDYDDDVGDYRRGFGAITGALFKF